VLRVLETDAGEPACNMALDEALLAGDHPATLRLYRWSPPGLSLGRFQAIEPFHAVPGPHHIVRRCTGGGAIYHDDEITFALTLDAGLLPADVATSYEVIHGAVQRALARIGVATRRVPGGTGCGLQARPQEPWCFAVPGAHDLVLAGSGRKIVGSAQRRLAQPRGRVLHHGSIPLRAPAPTPFCGAVGDVVDPVAATPALCAALVAELGAALGLRTERAAATPAELRTAQIARARFAPATPTLR
jgi:lipoate-protein ligase A